MCWTILRRLFPCFTSHKHMETVEEEGQKFKQPRQKLKIINPTQTKSSRDFALALKKMMKDFDCKYPEDNNELDENVPLALVCPNVRRLKPDVELAISSVLRSSTYVVIVLHIGSERNLPTLPSEQKLREYSNITFIDMGFNDQGAIFECQHNVEAEDQLRSFIDEWYANCK